VVEATSSVGRGGGRTKASCQKKAAAPTAGSATARQNCRCFRQKGRRRRRERSCRRNHSSGLFCLKSFK